MFKQLIKSSIIIPALAGQSKEDVIDELLQSAVGGKWVSAKQSSQLRFALLERERNGSTGIGNGIAVPHVKSAEVESMVLVLGCSAAGIPFQAVDGRDVQTLFMLLAPADEPEEHLRVLRWISTLARNADFRRFVQSATTESEIRDLLLEMSAV